jgi:protein phosphatase
MIDRGLLTPQNAENAPFRSVILQAMGQSPNVQVALGRLSLRQKDCLMLCSDGLTNKVSEDEIRDTILGATGLDAAADKLVSMAKERGGEDNITLILGGLSGELPAQVEGERLSQVVDVIHAWQPNAKSL